MAATKKRLTVSWFLDGPGGKWSIWDHGDELVVCRGPSMLHPTVVKVPPEVVRTMDDGHRRQHLESAASSIHVAKLAGWDDPVFHLLWR